jgi:hypothetical protein
MNRPDLDEFAALWQDGPDPLEQEQMEAYARTARRRGRMLDWLNYALAAALLLMLLIGSLISPSPLTLAVGVVLMIAVTWMTWRGRRLRQMTRSLSTTSRGAFIEGSLLSARANLRRNTLGLLSLPLVIPVAFAFKVSLRTGGGLHALPHALLAWAQTPRAAITIGVLLIMAAFVLRSRRKTRSEIDRLEGLRIGYELEAEHEGEG